MPDTLKNLIDELTVPHAREHEGTVGTEGQLLVLLEEAVGSDIGRGSGGSSSAPPGGVIDAHALDVLTSIRRVVRSEAPSLRPGDTLADTVRRWHSEATLWDAPAGDALALMTHALQWRADIRGILEPVKRFRLRGHACPGCGHDYFRNDVGEWNPAILVEVRSTPVASCGVCGETWGGGSLLDLQQGKLAEGVR